MPHADGLWYEQHGEGPPLVLSAGLGGSGAYWMPNLDALAKRFRVTLYDHRGTGRSDRALPETVTVSDLADDLIALLNRLGISGANVIGHAAGGVAALEMALKAPSLLRRIVVVNGWSAPDSHFARCFDTRLALLLDTGVRAYLRAQPIFLYPATWITANGDRLAAEEAEQFAHFQGEDTIRKRIAALRAFDIDARLAGIRVPVLALAAKDDMLVPWSCSERLAAGIPGARLATMPWGGHACNVTQPAAFDDLVLDFLRS